MRPGIVSLTIIVIWALGCIDVIHANRARGATAAHAPPGAVVVAGEPRLRAGGAFAMPYPVAWENRP